MEMDSHTRHPLYASVLCGHVFFLEFIRSGGYLSQRYYRNRQMATPPTKRGIELFLCHGRTYHQADPRLFLFLPVQIPFSDYRITRVCLPKRENRSHY